MNPASFDPFETPLAVDPTIALPAHISAPKSKAGPLHRVEFTIEFVGPRSLPGYAAARLLDYDWYGALGEPKAWGMRPQDHEWARLSGTKDGSYDSLAISWPMIGPKGDLSADAARSLWRIADEFGQAIDRKAVPIPPINDIPSLVKDLRKIIDTLDIGVSLTYVPARGTVMEKDLWVQCVALGLQFAPDGSFQWRTPQSESPLFSITPIGSLEQFSLRSVQAGLAHEGATIGFSVPRCPNPARAIEGALKTGRVLCERLGGRIVDDAGRFMDAKVAQSLIDETTHALKLFQEVKLAPGSVEAIALFENA